MKRITLDASGGGDRDVLEIVRDAGGEPLGVVWRARRDGAVTFEAASEIVIAGPLLEGLFREDGCDGAGLLVAHAALRAGATLRTPERLAVDRLAFEALGVPGAVDAALLAAGARVWIAGAGDARASGDIPQKDRNYVDDPSALRPDDRAFVDVTRVAAGDPARRCLARHFDWAGRADITHVPVFPWIRDAGAGFAPLARGDRDDHGDGDDGSDGDGGRDGDRRASELATEMGARLAKACASDGESVHLLFGAVSALVRRALLARGAGHLILAITDLEALASRARDARAPDDGAFMNRSIVALLQLDAALALGHVLLEARRRALTGEERGTEDDPLAHAPALPADPAARKLQLSITRCDAPGALSRRETFEIATRPRMTVHDALVAIRERPITVEGRTVAPVVWDAPCAREACGACTLLVGGQARLACTTLLEDVAPKTKPLRLAPLSKAECLRDLVADRSATPRLALPVVPARERDAPPVATGVDERDALARCIDCGACYEACPETARGRAFVGPAALAAARLASLASPPEARPAILDALMRDGGVAECGKAQSCVEVCPVDVPVYDAIAHLLRETTRRAFGRGDR